jgi:hypothetical protein
MASIMRFFQRLFGIQGVLIEDHLTGAVDLSDAQYCLGLLDANNKI